MVLTECDEVGGVRRLRLCSKLRLPICLSFLLVRRQDKRRDDKTILDGRLGASRETLGASLGGSRGGLGRLRGGLGALWWGLGGVLGGLGMVRGGREEVLDDLGAI